MIKQTIDNSAPQLNSDGEFGVLSTGKTRRLMLLLHVGFVLTGVVNTMLGPLLPALSARWGLTDERAGYLFTAQFSGSMVGVLGSSFLMSRGRHRSALMLGLGFMAMGSATLMAATWSIGLLAALCLGTGLGLAIPPTNLIVSELNPQKRASALSVLNFYWGAGAAASPFVVASVLRLHRIPHLLISLPILLVLFLVALVTGSFPLIQSTRNNFSEADHRLWLNRWVPILGAIFFLYVGCEAGVGGWTATYARRMTQVKGTEWVLMPSFFWAALLLGRATTPILLHRFRESRLAQYGLGISLAGLILLVAAKTLFSIAIGVALAGLGLSPVFPIAIAALSSKFGSNSSRIAGPMFALAGAGGATLPWLIGYISTLSGNLSYGLAVPLIGCAVMLMLNSVLSPRPAEFGET